MKRRLLLGVFQYLMATLGAAVGHLVLLFLSGGLGGMLAGMMAAFFPPWIGWLFLLPFIILALPLAFVPLLFHAKFDTDTFFFPLNVLGTGMVITNSILWGMAYLYALERWCRSSSREEISGKGRDDEDP